MNAPPTKERKKPGRKAETPAQRLARLEREMEAARRAVEEAEARTLATIGKAVLAEAEDNPAFKGQLQQLLRARVTTKAGKADIAPVLAGSVSTASERANASACSEPAGPRRLRR